MANAKSTSTTQSKEDTGLVQVGETMDKSIVADEKLIGDSAHSFAPSLRETMEIQADINALRQSLEDGFGDYTSPSDLAIDGTVFDIVDAYLTSITDDHGEEVSKVVFHLVEQATGLFHKVMQSDDSRGIRRKYATLFGLCKAQGIPSEPLIGYKFIVGDKKIAGNHAIILTRAEKRIARG